MKKMIIFAIIGTMITVPVSTVRADIGDVQNAFSDLISDGNNVQISEIIPYDGYKILQVTETINGKSDTSTDFIFGVTSKIKEIAQEDWFDYDTVFQDIYSLDRSGIRSTSIYDFSSNEQSTAFWGSSGSMSLYNISDDKMIKSTGLMEDVDVSNDADSNSDSETSVSSPTLSQQNALDAASNYLGISAFSYSGLIQQLKFEQYSDEDATYAADHCGANWNEQAAKAAQNCLDISSFSKDGLIQQLKFEGFTDEQAEYGVQAVGY